jgi:hypothetical protein
MAKIMACGNNQRENIIAQSARKCSYRRRNEMARPAEKHGINGGNMA